MIKSFAKVNLNLKVFKKHPNENYHKINSLFTIVKDFYDKIYLKIIESGIIIKSNIEEINNENNLVYKAVQFLIQKHNLKNGFLIKINKKIPLGSGLGGANSNAIFVCKYIVKKFKLNEDLIDVCRITGMDSYFFNSEYKTSLVKGFGEIVEKYKTIKISKKDLIFTNIKCETKKVYEKFEMMNVNEDRNSLTQAAMSIYPELQKFSKHLMSGSGSTFINIKKIKKLKLE